MYTFEPSELLKRLPKQFFAELVGKAAAVAAQGHDVINLGQGNPDQPTPGHIVEALQSAAANPLNHKYPPFRGHSYLKEAAAAALLGPQQCVQELVDRYESRRDTLLSGLRSIGWEAKVPGGSFFVWLPVPGGHTSRSFADLLLTQAHVVVAPGIGFGACGEGYVRVSLVSEEARLVEAVRRIAKLKLFS